VLSLVLTIAPAPVQDPPQLGLVPGSVVSSDGVVHVEGRLLVGWQPDADPAEVEAELAESGLHVERTNPRLGLMFVVLPEGRRAEQERVAVAALPGVRYAELDAVGMGGLLAPPNDPYFKNQWQLYNTADNLGFPGADMEALAAWDLETGDAAVVLAVLDTGTLFSSPEFAARSLPGYDFVNNDADPTADHPHGVWVQALAAAEAGNAFGVAGLDRACSVLPVKVLNAANGGATTWLVDGLDYCAQQGVDVVSMSLINYPSSQAIENALQGCLDAGCILVACAGNSGVGDADLSWPGASPRTISVGATDGWDQRPSWSGSGQALDFVAPGLNTVTLKSNGSDSTDYFSGCSAATPLAAAVVSLCKAQDPALDQAAAYERLRVGAEDKVGPTGDTVGWDQRYGWGRLNAHGSLDPFYARYCSPAAPNSTGQGSVLTAAGSSLAADNDLKLIVSLLPKGVLGYFVGSLTQGPGVTPPGSQGTLCLGGTVARFSAQVKDSGSSGSFQVKIDLTAIPLHGPVQPGDSWNMQCWHRDQNPDRTSNFSDAVTITFQ